MKKIRDKLWNRSKANYEDDLRLIVQQIEVDYDVIFEVIMLVVLHLILQ